LPAFFEPRLVNDPFGDPGLFVQLMFERRALLFDLGDLSPLSPRLLLRISDVFVSHRHMDHFSGFDQLLRVLLGREHTLNIYGTPGLIDGVEHKLVAYTWNLLSGYSGNLRIRAHEHVGDQLKIAQFQSRNNFSKESLLSQPCSDCVLLREPRFKVRAAVLDHGIPNLGFALEETVRINVWRDRVEALGLAIGPWLGDLKQAVARNNPDETPIPVDRLEPNAGSSTALPLGQLKRAVLSIEPGRKIAYIVDVAFTKENAEKIIHLAKNAEIVFIEAAFLEADVAHARARQHLTARQAGSLSREAKAKRIVTFHYSPRYNGRGEELQREAVAALNGQPLD